MDSKKTLLGSKRALACFCLSLVLSTLLGAGCSDKNDSSDSLRSIGSIPGQGDSAGQGGEGPEAILAFDEYADWNIVSFTDPRDNSTYDVVEGRVLVALKNAPVMPVRNPDYFDVESGSIALNQWQQDFNYPATYLTNTDVAAFLTAENLQCYSEWPMVASFAVILPAGQTIADAVANWPHEYPNLIERVDPDVVNVGGTLPLGDPSDEHFAPHLDNPVPDSVGQWSLDNRFNPAHYDNNVLAVWKRNDTAGLGQTSRVIAILDTGVEYNGQGDLQVNSASYNGSKYGVNVYDSLSSTRWGLRQNGLGRPDPAYLNYNAHSAHALNHGTFISGITSAGLDNDGTWQTGGPHSWNDDKDIAGLAKNCKYSPLRSRQKELE